jgi:hypothetical protein
LGQFLLSDYLVVFYFAYEHFFIPKRCVLWMLKTWWSIYWQ